MNVFRVLFLYQIHNYIVQNLFYYLYDISFEQKKKRLFSCLFFQMKKHSPHVLNIKIKNNKIKILKIIRIIKNRGK